MSGIVAIVPARAGSKGLAGKNIRPLAGRPLYARAVDQALAAGIATVAISTDIDAILTASHPAGVRAYRRPPDLCGDTVPMDLVLLDHLARHGPQDDIVVLLQPTSPLRRVSDIAAAIDLYHSRRFDLVMSVTPHDSAILKMGLRIGDRFVALADPRHPFMNRQALPPVFRPNGAVYVFGAAWFLANGGMHSERTGIVTMDAESSVDIDTLADFALCEEMLARRERNR